MYTRTQYDERLAKSNARANAKVAKRTGKPVMFRSAPLNKKKVEKKQTTQEVRVHLLSCYMVAAAGRVSRTRCIIAVTWLMGALCRIKIR